MQSSYRGRSTLRSGSAPGVAMFPLWGGRVCVQEARERPAPEMSTAERRGRERWREGRGEGERKTKERGRGRRRTEREGDRDRETWREGRGKEGRERETGKVGERGKRGERKEGREEGGKRGRGEREREETAGYSCTRDHPTLSPAFPFPVTDVCVRFPGASSLCPFVPKQGLIRMRWR